MPTTSRTGTTRVRTPVRGKLLSWSNAVDSLLTPRRIRHYSLMALMATVAFYLASIAAGRPPFDAFGHPIAVDFSAQVTAGRIALDGDLQRLYDARRQFAVQQQLLGGEHRQFFNPFISPPVAAYLWLPFASAPYLAAAAIWTLLSASLLVVSLALLWPVVPKVHRYGFPSILLLLLSTQIAIELLADGEDSALSLLLFVVGLRLFLCRRDLEAGAVLGLGVFKPQLFAVMPLLFLLQRRWRALGSWLAAAAALTLLSVALVGTAGVRSYLHLLTSDLYTRGIALPLAWKMQSLVGLARGLLPEPLAGAALPVAALCSLPLLAAFTRAAATPAAGRRETALLYALAMLLVAIGNPHFFVYDCVILIVPVLVLLNDVPESTPAVRLSLAAVYVLTWTAAARHLLFASLPWPLSILGASWTAVPLLVLFRLLFTRALSKVPGHKSRPHPARPGDPGLPAAALTSEQGLPAPVAMPGKPEQ